MQISSVRLLRLSKQHFSAIPSRSNMPKPTCCCTEGRMRRTLLQLRKSLSWCYFHGGFRCCRWVIWFPFVQPWKYINYIMKRRGKSGPAGFLSPKSNQLHFHSHRCYPPPVHRDCTQGPKGPRKVPPDRFKERVRNYISKWPGWLFATKRERGHS